VCVYIYYFLREKRRRPHQRGARFCLPPRHPPLRSWVVALSSLPSTVVAITSLSRVRDARRPCSRTRRTLAMLASLPSGPPRSPLALPSRALGKRSSPKLPRGGEPGMKSHGQVETAPLFHPSHIRPLVHLSLHARSPPSPPLPVLGPTQAAHASSRSPPIAPPHRTRPRRRPPRRRSRTSSRSGSNHASSPSTASSHPLSRRIRDSVSRCPCPRLQHSAQFIPHRSGD
jgi:hypothetical protein